MIAKKEVFGWFGAMGAGITGMGELIIITLMAGGMLELIRFNGGIDYILYRLSRHVGGKRGGEFCIAALVSLANICTANNTIAIITVGPLANQIAEKYRIDTGDGDFAGKGSGAGIECRTLRWIDTVQTDFPPLHRERQEKTVAGTGTENRRSMKAWWPH